MSAGPGQVGPDVAADALRSSHKYALLCDQALLRTASWAVARTGTVREAVKLAKRKLHQVHGAYVTGWKPDLPDLWRSGAGGAGQLGAAWAGDTGRDVTGKPDCTSASLKDRCVQAMSLHASTREGSRSLSVSTGRCSR